MAKSKLGLKNINTHKLTDKQRKFVSEYCIDYNATRAAKEAGYKNPTIMGSRLLNGKDYPKISKAVADIQSVNQELNKISKEQIISELSNIALRDVIDLCDENGNFVIDNFNNIPAEIRRCIDGVDIEEKEDPRTGNVTRKIKINMSKKLVAMEMLMKHMGMFAPQEHNVTHGIDWDAFYQDEQTVDPLDIIKGEIEKAGE